MTIDTKGKFHEKLANGEVITEGSWKISQIEDSEEKKTYPVMVLSQVEDGVQIDLHYLIQMDNDLVQLIYFAAYANGQYVEEDEETANENEDDSDQVILLYKAK
ncbi:hypothetical protein QNI19_17970 [Cytophagaceae bacterium DM2B3-1]|uniref:Uncharacterized protein n=1 Tax=Xanthocytophaga flava TaxID=3048013 RepID=A0ABT7CMB7_9BACT|nr:hypothetical protein [Xanthocytophaga flavus]MDJ1467321.1 hypothetical protein [Xanthocytophaga flavus]MDJ1494832.1 hypothetical protein [Xanthocytophaga flavus]